MKRVTSITFSALMALTAFSATPSLSQESRLPSDDLFQAPTRAAHRFDNFVYTLKERQAEATQKVERLRKVMKDKKWDAVVIATERNLNWLTAGGKNTVVWVQRETAPRIVVTADKLQLVADNIEGPRMMAEELSGLGYEWISFNWYEGEAKTLGPLLKGKKVAFDTPAQAASFERDPVKNVYDFQDVYYPITQGELKKWRWLGRKTSEILEQVAGVVKPGMTERDVQYLLAREFWYWDIVPTVLLTAVDERFRTYKHPVVVGATMKNYVALNVCTRRWGLTVSTTRLVYFGTPDDRLAKAWAEGPKVYGAMWAASKPGATLGDVIEAAQKAYASIGLPEEWKLHHQGGMIMGLERLYLVAPGDTTKIKGGMVLAWNPTAQGSKFEDTIYVREDGTLENLTPAIKWPTVPVKVGDRTILAPGLLIKPLP